VVSRSDQRRFQAGRPFRPAGLILSSKTFRQVKVESQAVVYEQVS
jgi:hypothetical protein